MVCWACEMAAGEKKWASSRMPLLAARLGAAVVSRSKGVRSRRKAFLVKVICAPLLLGDVCRLSRGRLRSRLGLGCRMLGKVVGHEVTDELRRSDKALVVVRGFLGERRDQNFHQFVSVLFGEGFATGVESEFDLDVPGVGGNQDDDPVHFEPAA